MSEYRRGSHSVFRLPIHVVWCTKYRKAVLGGVSIPPQVSVSKLVQKLKGKSSYKLQRESGVLRKQYWGQRMWARGYFACSTGNVTDEMIAEYIRSHSETEDQIRVVGAGDFESR
ncbi:MAG: IS200/IS605 family transposase [Candidatus Thiosymbion ectosymbiont of Robbea hypermnestra]|nr:IS200/IS605 family transposase [Candidatus Thiosymbion ectosymbiont of Robbea hypermnestra]